MFLVNRKRTARYVLIMDDPKEVDVNRLVTTLGENRLSFGSAERLAATLGLESGVVSPFGLIDPDHREMALLFDTEMLEEETLTFRPGDNRATIFRHPGPARLPRRTRGRVPHDRSLRAGKAGPRARRAAPGRPADTRNAAPVPVGDKKPAYVTN
ncbi:YbaK/EbsC family protein [Streptomyces rochei]|uniref:YbaK/EbsC family protein n=1 Tax=Streptomyces rochei TaxID=1928 RepID=UPI0033B5C014